MIVSGVGEDMAMWFWYEGGFLFLFLRFGYLFV